MSLLLVLLSTVALAAPSAMPIVSIEVERDAIGYSFIQDLPAADVEPGGLLVPADASAHWTALGFKIGDVIRFVDSSPAAERLIIGNGITTFEIVRNGKPMILRLLVHGPQVEAETLKETDYQDVVKRLANGDPHATPVNANGKPSGVRIVDMLLRFDLELAIGDIVRSIDGKPIRTEAEFIAAIQNLRVGRTDIEITRYGRPVTIEITRPQPADFSTIKRIAAAKFEVPRAIADAIDADPQLVVRKVEVVPVVTNGEVRGVRLYKIEKDSLCAALGFQNDDIILDVDGHSVVTFSDAIDTAQALAHTPNITVNVQRKNRDMAILYAIK